MFYRVKKEIHPTVFTPFSSLFFVSPVSRAHLLRVLPILSGEKVANCDRMCRQKFERLIGVICDLLARLHCIQQNHFCCTFGFQRRSMVINFGMVRLNFSK